jgi:hypothetical protein
VLITDPNDPQEAASALLQARAAAIATALRSKRWTEPDKNATDTAA